MKTGLYDGWKYRLFVDEENLQELPKNGQKHTVVVTFHGSWLLPSLLEARLPRSDPASICLRFTLTIAGTPDHTCTALSTRDI